MEYDDYLVHYGVKGMKWGVRKNRDSSSGPNRKQRKQNIRDAYAKYLDNDAKNVREVNAEAKRLRKEEGVPRRESLAKAEKNTGFNEKQDRALNEYKQTVTDNTTRGDKVRDVAEGVLLVTAGAAIVADMASGNRLSRTAASKASEGIKRGYSFFNSIDLDNVYINPDGSRIKYARPNFGGTTTQVFPKEVTRGLRSLTR